MKNLMIFITSLLFIVTIGFGTTINIPADHTTIQAGIDASSNGDTVLVHPGSYVENINFNRKNIVVGSLILTTQDTSYISSTIIDGNQNGSVVTISGGLSSTAVLSGFTIRNGSATHGGGIYFSGSSQKLKNLVISENTAIKYGGGIYYNSSSNDSLVNVRISGNTASTSGGGIYYTNSSNSSLVNVTISGNIAFVVAGGILCVGGSNPSLVNVTISGNSSGFYCDNSSTPSLLNTIIADNFGSELYSSGGSVVATYSLIQGGWPGIGNIDADPYFMDATNGDYRLSDYSPCIGTGLDTSIVPTTDIEGNPRPNPTGSIPDMGAYENALAAPSSPPVPTSLTATSGNQQITLTWNQNTESDFAKYIIYGGTSTSPVTKVDSTTSVSDTTKTITGLTNGSTYYYRITAVDGAGNESGYSNETHVTPAIVASGLVAYYPFSGNAFDGSGNGNDGTVNGATLVSDRFGNANSAYSFDGVNDYIQIPHNDVLNIQDEITISYSVKLETSAPYYFPYHIIQKSGSWGSGQRGFDIHFGLEGVTSPNIYSVFHTGFSPETFYQLVLTYNGTIAKWYEDGVLKDSVVVSDNIPITTTDIWIGQNAQDLRYNFDGIIDDIRIYNRALISSEIDSLYHLGGWDSVPSAPTNLIAASGNRQVTLTWSPNTESDIYKYNIYRFSAPPTALVDSVLHPDTTYIDTGLTNDLTYHYHITAVDSAGDESGASNTVSVTPTYVPIPYNNFLWSARFGGRVGDVVDLHNYVGVIEGATLAGPDSFDEPEPPHAPSNYISLYFNVTNPSSVLAYPVDWGTEHFFWLSIDTDLNRDQPFILELELAQPSLYGVNVYSYEYSTPSSGNFYHLVWGIDSTVVSVEFPVIPLNIRFQFDDLIGREIHFESPPPDSTIYRIGGEMLPITLSPTSVSWHLFFYSYMRGVWDHIAYRSGNFTSYNWSNTPYNDFGYLRLIHSSPSDDNKGTAISGDVVFFDNNTSLNEGWSFLSIPHSGGDGHLSDKIWHPALPVNYYLYTYINNVGWVDTEQLNHNKGYAINLPNNYSIGYIDSSYDNMDLSLDIGSGWNLIGSPYRFNKSLHDAAIIHESNPSDTLTFDEAVSSGLLFGTVYDYGDNANYSTTDILVPWKSYWLASLTDSLTFIYPSVQYSALRYREYEWVITLNSIINDIITSSIELGYNEHATNGFDPGYDFPKPPPFPVNGFLNMFIDHSDWETGFGNKYMSDFRNLSLDQTWIINAVNDTVRPITLSWTLENLFEDVYPYLIVGNDTIDMMQYSEVDLDNTDQFPIMIWTSDIYLSASDESQILPNSYALHDAFPNPFNPITTLRYDLPKNSFIRITIYDLLGREVKSLVNATQDAGFKSVIWDATNDYGKPVSAGVYLYQIRAGEFVQTKKMVLLK